MITRDEPLPYIRYRERYGLGRRIGGFADSLNERMWLIQLGMGIGFLPKPVVDSSNFAAALWPLLPDEEAPVCSVYLMATRTAPVARLHNSCWIPHWRICRQTARSSYQLLCCSYAPADVAARVFISQRERRRWIWNYRERSR